MRTAPERCAIKSRANSHQYEISIALSPRRRRASANRAEGHDQDTLRMLFLQEKLQTENSSSVGADALSSVSKASWLWGIGSVPRRSNQRTDTDNAEKKSLDGNLVGNSNLAKTSREQQVKRYPADARKRKQAEQTIAEKRR